MSRAWRGSIFRIALVTTLSSFAVALAVPSQVSAVSTSLSVPVSSSGPPPYPCWGTPPNHCSTYVGETAADYADTYAINPNKNVYPVYDDDCTNFVSQAVLAGGHSMIAPIGGPYGDVAVQDDYQWWWAVVSMGAGRTFSWSVADDLWKFANLPVSSSNVNVYRDPYGTIGQYQYGYPPAVLGSFISNKYMSSANIPPKDYMGYAIGPLSAGDIIFYNWKYNGDNVGNGFYGNHDSIVVSQNGTDPKSGWVGPLVDSHTNNRYHAIWSLIPYNSQATTTAGWWDQFFQYGPPANPSADKWRPVMNRLRNIHIDPYVRGPAIKAGPTPAVTTPSTRVGQRAYSGARRVEGDLPTAQLAAVERAFEAGMVERQQLDVPSSAGVSPAALQPSAAALGKMAAIGSQRITALFAGAALQSERRTLQNAQNWEVTSDVRALGGGADHFHYALIKMISPTQVELRGTVHAWAKVAQVQASGRIVPAIPSNVLDVVATLTHFVAGWKISSMDWAFAPGSQP